MVMPRAVAVKRGEAHGAQGLLVLAYDDRMLRRKRVTLSDGSDLMIDLAETTSLNDGDALLTESGEKVAVRAADEAVLRICGDELVRLAWHIGNRHTPCQIATDHLIIQDNPVLAEMLRGLGAQITALTTPFSPEGGAYGLGRTMGHSHDH
ncbi:MAG: urease accessory protein [Paracoccaceae bacterium]|jgi:urease accessory protein